MGNILSKLPKDAAEEILSLETPNTSSAFKRVMTSGSGNSNTGLWLSENAIRVESLNINTQPPTSLSRTNILRIDSSGQIQQVDLIDNTLISQNVIGGAQEVTYRLSEIDNGSEIEIDSTSSNVNVIQVGDDLPIGFNCYVSLTQGALRIDEIGDTKIVDKTNTQTTVNIEDNRVFFLTMKTGNRMRVIQL